jgi:hypothetical protein
MRESTSVLFCITIVVACCVLPVVASELGSIEYDSSNRVFIIVWHNFTGTQETYHLIPGNLVHPIVDASVRREATKQVYEYMASNNPAADDSFYAHIWIECAESRVWGIAPQAWEYCGRPYNRSYVSFLTGTCGISIGDPPSKFVLESDGLPGIGSFLALGLNRSRGGMPAEAFPDVPKWIRDSVRVLLRVENNAARVWTVTPVYVHTLSEADYLDSLIVDASEALELGWLSDQATLDTISTSLAVTRDAFRSDDSGLAVASLDKLFAFLERAHPERVDDNAHTLYTAAIEYLKWRAGR